ncbi:MAG: YnbE family lipoprotein [Alphaproteobacteria bacterium]
MFHRCLPSLLLSRTIFASAVAIVVAGCDPTVRVEAPREPITINLNIKLDADIRLRVEEQAKDDVRNQPIF